MKNLNFIILQSISGHNVIVLEIRNKPGKNQNIYKWHNIALNNYHNLALPCLSKAHVLKAWLSASSTDELCCHRLTGTQSKLPWTESSKYVVKINISSLYVWLFQVFCQSDRKLTITITLVPKKSHGILENVVNWMITSILIKHCGMPIGKFTALNTYIRREFSVSDVDSTLRN
jgi:hypothetical protein